MTFKPIAIFVIAWTIPMGTIQKRGMMRQTINAHQMKLVLHTRMVTNDRATWVDVSKTSC